MDVVEVLAGRVADDAAEVGFVEACDPGDGRRRIVEAEGAAVCLVVEVAGIVCVGAGPARESALGRLRAAVVAAAARAGSDIEEAP